MNRLTGTLYLLSALLLANGCGRAEGHASNSLRNTKVTVTRSWPAEHIRELKVIEVEGNVSIEAAPGNEISLVADASGRLDVQEGAENQGLFQTELDGDTLRIGRKQHRRRGFRIPILWGRNHKRINYTLRVPPSVALDLTTVNGRVVTRGMDGDAEIKTVNGSIDVETSGNHELYATTVNGRVKAKFLSSFQGARFKTVNGGVYAVLPSSASFNVQLSQVNGDFEASFPVSIHSNPGSRRVSGEVNGGNYDLKITTVNGDVELASSNGKL